MSQTSDGYLPVPGGALFVVALVVLFFWLSWWLMTKEIRDEIKKWRDEAQRWRRAQKTMHEETLEALKKKE